MKYKKFLETAAEELRERLGDGYQVMVQKIPRNNGRMRYGLAIRKNTEKMAAVVYMELFYMDYLHTKRLDEAMAVILKEFRGSGILSNVIMKDPTDFSQIKDGIVLKLINAEANRKLLEEIPHILWLDMAIVFYILLSKDSDGQMTALIHEEHVGLWGTTVDELYSLAMNNTPRLYPVKIEHILETLKDCAEIQEEKRGLYDDFNEEPPMYVLSNSTGFYGAACMLPGMGIGQFAKQQEKDFIVLPSSVHEVLLVPFTNTLDLGMLRETVKMINATEVLPEERLSDEIYFFSRENGMQIVDADGTVTGNIGIGGK